LIFGLLAVLLLGVQGKLYAQASTAITGTITDASGAVVPNAKVTVTNTATQVVNRTESNSAGTYVMPDLLPGTYTVQVEAPGFQISIHNGVLLEVGRNSTVDVALATGNVSTSVEVQESAITLNTTQPELGTTIENKVVQELPLEISGGRGRQIDSFVFLAPGVTGGTFSKRINGGTDFQSEVVFNGIPMAQSETQGFQTIWNPPFEQVSEFNVLRSSFSAQYGLAQGVVTYQTTSGTNTFHGSGFEILRNDFFDARGSFNAVKPVDKENNYGFSFGGPVRIPHLYNGKNKTFFFVTAEWYRLNQTNTSLTSLPTAAEKNGNFTGVNTIYDPLSPGTPFVNDSIPVSRFSPLSASLIPSMPNPNLAGLVNNFTSELGVQPQRQYPWGFNIDHTINDKQSIHWSEWRDKQTSFGTEGPATLPLGNKLSSVSSTPDLGTVFLLNYVNSFTPHLVMTVGASWLGELNDQISLTKNVTFAAAPGAQQLPEITFSGPSAPTGFGATWIESVNRKLGWVLENNYLWIKGKQTFNIGIEARRTYQDDNECQRCAGQFGFSNDQTANPADFVGGNSATSGNAFASYLLGTVDNAARYGTYELRLRNFDVSPYIQDDIKIRPNLTINVGVRWDIMQPFTENNNLIVFFDSKVANPAAGGLPGAALKFGNCTGCAGFTRADTKYNHFSPRIGFSYSPNNKTVVQGGFSWNYLDGGAYEYGTAKVAVNYANLLDGSFQRSSTGNATAAFGSWDNNILPAPAPIPFSQGLGVGGQIDAFSKNDGIAPYDMVWSLNVQRELPFNILLNATYTGNRANFLPGQLNPINQLPNQYLSLGANVLGSLVGSATANAAGIQSPYPNFINNFGGSATVLQALRPYPQYAGIFNNFDDSASSLYNAAQIQIEKRYTNGLSFLVSYTLSHALSNTSSGFTSFSNFSLNKNNQKAEWTVDGSDEPQALSIAGTYELPIGPGKKFLNKNNLTGKMLGGWQISPLLTYASGTPLSLGVDNENALGNGFNRPNINTSIPLNVNYGNANKGGLVFNTAAFSDPGLYTPGNTPRNLAALRSPAGLNENVALSKSFPIGEHVKAKIEMEYFNLLNRFIPGTPDTNLGDANFGKVINSQGNTQRQGQAHFSIRF